MLFPDSITKVENHLYSNNYRIYPNPSNQFATLEFNNSKNLNCTLILYDIYGRLVHAINNIITDKIVIDRGNLISGIYFFKLYTEGEVIATGKLTIK